MFNKWIQNPPKSFVWKIFNRKSHKLKLHKWPRLKKGDEDSGGSLYKISSQFLYFLIQDLSLRNFLLFWCRCVHLKYEIQKGILRKSFTRITEESLDGVEWKPQIT